RYPSLIESPPRRPGALDGWPELRPGDASPGTGPDGAVLYARHCTICHGSDGGADGPNTAYLPTPPTAHADGGHMSTRPDDALFDGIHAGGRILGKSHRMPAFGATLGPGEIRALVAHMRTLCACSGPAWSEDGR
ncbi:MAG: c-type cytochrome, partial [Gemmatimonadetes bacterium]|nr:cytochrome c [Gemmatimonadota bacterium]NIQ59897.1 cytochrome c [Gemmatimonadota bacterium]NIU80090.1 c-type cytochrome [Gammaproteobacteria bacterium]NIX48510.1 c-type cytochrome [Gemmatimonadota bacterium]